MKKNILFLIGNLESGGVSKSMVSLLNTIDRKRYDISLWVGNPSGIFYELLPKDITILSDERISSILKGIHGLRHLLRMGNVLLFFGSIIRIMLSCVDKGYAGWLLSRLLPAINNDVEYDMIVDYNGQHQLYYMVDKLKGKKKVTFFHSDYSKWPYYYRIDKKYYPKVDYIFTISDICVQSLKSYFPAQARKIGLMENISSPAFINQMANEEIHDFRKSELSLLSLGHVTKSKGTDLAIKAAAILKEKGIVFKWYFIGKEVEDFHQLIGQCGVEDNIVFLGLRTNPYPYIKQADFYVHPSRLEGKSIALEEAKILCKPIVVTNFSTVKDQVEDHVDASICEMTPESVSDAIIELINNNSLKDGYIKYLANHVVDNSCEVEKLYRILED